MDYLISISDQLMPQLRSMRKARGLSQKELAARLSLSQSRIAAIESNPAAISAGQLLKILAILDVQLILRDMTKLVISTPTQGPEKSDSVHGGEW